ncbi:hypothetical protein VZT92_002073 [Zoarces viviparus]|uniref:Peptidase A2 domain-containing protein n=1 Tax=Zoarces viviparus TaxID=48416 RepID=A0AAW1G5R2_ZOAVI
MPTADSSGGRPCHLLASCWVQETSPAHMIPVKVDGRDAEALVDSGSVVSLVQPHLLEPSRPGEMVPVSCVHGDTKEYPTAVIKLTTVKGSCQLKVGVVPSLPDPVLVGQDCPLYYRLRQDNQRSPPRTKSGCKSKSREKKPTPISSSHQDTPKVVCAALEQRRDNPRSNTEETLDNLVFAFPLGPGTDGEEDEASLLPSLKGQFGTAQMEDPNLLPARSNVMEIEGKLAPGVGKLTYPCFTIKNKLLYYTKKTEGQRRDLLVVPKQYVSTVLHLALLAFCSTP